MRLLQAGSGRLVQEIRQGGGRCDGFVPSHGDQAIYDALVRLAQEFFRALSAGRWQGNFGNIDGDNAAAMRYTESRMTEACQRLLHGLDENAWISAPPMTAKRRAGGAAGGVSQSSGQWLQRHRRGHGDLDPAAQSGRALRRHHRADRKSRHPGPQPAEIRQGSGFPTGGILVEEQASIAGSL
jgi:topoisomerase-4 subunit A